MIYFRFELINAVLQKTMIQRNVELFLYVVLEKNVVNMINVYQMQSLSSLSCILGQIALFDFKSSMLIFVSQTKLNDIRNDLFDDCLTELPCTTMEIRET